MTVKINKKTLLILTCAFSYSAFSGELKQIQTQFTTHDYLNNTLVEMRVVDMPESADWVIHNWLGQDLVLKTEQALYLIEAGQYFAQACDVQTNFYGELAGRSIHSEQLPVSLSCNEHLLIGESQK